MPRKGGGGDSDEPELGGKGAKARAMKDAAATKREAEAAAKRAAEEAKSWEDGSNKRAANKKEAEAKEREVRSWWCSKHRFSPAVQTIPLIVMTVC